MIQRNSPINAQQRCGSGDGNNRVRRGGRLRPSDPRLIATIEKKPIAACIVDLLVSDMAPILPLFTRHVLHISEGEETLSSIYAELLPFWGITTDPSQAANLKKVKADTSPITCPTLCLNDAIDYPELHRQAHEAAATMLKSTLRNFTSVERTGAFRELDNFSLKHRGMFDWLDGVFDYRADRECKGRSQ